MINDDDFMIDMGERIKQARDAAGLTQEQLAEKMGVGTQFISDLERAKSGISVRRLRQLCQICAVSSDQILFGLDEDREIPFIIALACRLPEHKLKIFEKYTVDFFDLMSELSEEQPEKQPAEPDK